MPRAVAPPEAERGRRVFPGTDGGDFGIRRVGARCGRLQDGVVRRGLGDELVDESGRDLQLARFRRGLARAQPRIEEESKRRPKTKAMGSDFMAI